MNILIADDMADNISLLQALLEGAGYGVVPARNGKEALVRLGEGAFAMIISDILMPVMDGFQLCRACKTNPQWRAIPFVFYTATYRVKAGGAVLLTPQNVTRTRIYTWNEIEVLAKDHEETLLRGALAREIAGVIARRLATIEIPAPAS